jgi:hypothetical protein
MRLYADICVVKLCLCFTLNRRASFSFPLSLSLSLSLPPPLNINSCCTIRQLIQPDSTSVSSGWQWCFVFEKPRVWISARRLNVSWFYSFSRSKCWDSDLKTGYYSFISRDFQPVIQNLSNVQHYIRINPEKAPLNKFKNGLDFISQNSEWLW